MSEPRLESVDLLVGYVTGLMMGMMEPTDPRMARILKTTRERGQAIEAEAAAMEREAHHEYIEIRDPDDELVGYGSWHIERMDDDDVWIGLYTSDGGTVMVDFTYAKGRKVAMVVNDERDQPTAPPPRTTAEAIIRAERRGAAMERKRLESEGWHAPQPDCGPLKAMPHEHTYVWGSGGTMYETPPTGTPCLGCGHRYGEPEGAALGDDE